MCCNEFILTSILFSLSSVSINVCKLENETVDDVMRYDDDFYTHYN